MAAFRHDAFISYSRKNTAFSKSIEDALESYTPPKGIGPGARRLDIFRDEQDMTGGEYFASVENHLAQSRKLIVVCSPDARRSQYVNDEIRRFIALRGAQHVIPVLAGGVPNNAAIAGQEEEMAFPPALVEAMAMPLAVGYSGFQPSRDRPSRGLFYGPWYTLLANLLDVSRADIEERDRKRRARSRRIAASAIVAIVVTLSTLTVWAMVERRLAEHRGKITLAGRLTAQARISTGLQHELLEQRALLATEALVRLRALNEPALEAAQTLRDVLAALPRTFRLPAGHRDFAFSPNGQFALAARGSSIAISSARTGAQIGTLQAPSPLRSLVPATGWDRFAAIQTDGTIAMWDGFSGSPAALFSAPGGEAICAALSPDGRHLAALLTPPGGPRNAIRLVAWRTADRALVAERNVPVGAPPAPPSGDCITIQEEHLLLRYRTAGADVLDPGYQPSALYWRWRPPAEAPPGPLAFSAPGLAPAAGRDILGPWTGLRDAALSLDGKLVVIVDSSGAVSTVDTAAGSTTAIPGLKQISQLSPRAVLALAFRSTEDPYVPLLRYMTVRVLNRETGDEQGEVAETGGTVWTSPESSTLVTSAGTRVRLWNTGDGRETARVSAAQTVKRVVISPSARGFAAIGEDGSIEVWDTADPSEVLRVPASRAAASSADGRLVAVAGQGSIHLFDGITGSRQSTLPVPGTVDSLQMSPDGNIVVATTPDATEILAPPERRRTLVFDTRRGLAPAVTRPFSKAFTFSPDGKWLAIGDVTGGFVMLKTPDLSVVWERRVEAEVSSLVFDADSKTLSLAFPSTKPPGYTVAVLDAVTGAERFRIAGRQSPVAALSPGAGEVATVAQAGLVEVSAAGSSAAALSIRHPATLETVTHVSFSADGRRIITSAGNEASTFFGAARFFTEQAIFVWSRRDGSLVERLPHGKDGNSDYRGTLSEEEKPYVAGALWMANSSRLAGIVFPSRLNYWAVTAARASAEFRVWDFAGSGAVELFRVPAGLDARLLSSSAAGRRLIATSDGMLRIWDLDPAGLVESACARVGRNLSQAEWNQFIGAAEPYRATCPPASTPPPNR